MHPHSQITKKDIMREKLINFLSCGIFHPHLSVWLESLVTVMLSNNGILMFTILYIEGNTDMNHKMSGPIQSLPSKGCTKNNLILALLNEHILRSIITDWCRDFLVVVRNLHIAAPHCFWFFRSTVATYLSWYSIFTHWFFHFHWQLLGAYLSKAPIPLIESFVKMDGFYLLANQLRPFTVCTTHVEIATSIFLQQEFTFNKK